MYITILLVLNVPLYLQMLNLLWTYSFRVYHILSLFLPFRFSRVNMHLFKYIKSDLLGLLFLTHTHVIVLYTFDVLVLRYKGEGWCLETWTALLASFPYRNYHLCLTWNEHHFSLIRCFQLNSGLLKLFLSNWRLFSIYIVLSLIQYSFIW